MYVCIRIRDIIVTGRLIKSPINCCVVQRQNTLQL